MTKVIIDIDIPDSATHYYGDIKSGDVIFFRKDHEFWSFYDKDMWKRHSRIDNSNVAYNVKDLKDCVVPELKEYEHKDREPEEIYDSFWKEIVEKDGCIDMTQLKKELADYNMVLSNAGKVYCHVTGGLISKLNTDARVVCDIADEHYERLYNGDDE